MEKTAETVGTKNGSVDISRMIGFSSKFANLNRLITRDLNRNTSTPTFYLYNKDDIAKYLSNPYTYEKQLRQAVVYIYGASSHFRRLIQYFTGLSDLAYVVQPYRVDPKKASARIVNNNYRKVLDLLSCMNIKTQCEKMITVCLREDVVYCTLHVTKDSVTVQHLPSDFCAISSIEGNVLNVTFDFSYFDSRQALLDYYPEEFRRKYQQYLSARNTKWIELDSPNSFAIKCNKDILDYAIPPFAGLLREIYDIEDYKSMKAAKTALENYAMVEMTLPMTDEGEWGIDLDKAKDFWMNLDSVLPEEVGSVLTPMKLSKISFEKSNTGDTNTVADAEEALFSAAGVSSLLFSNAKASANALLLSIKADQAITYSIVKSIEDAINRFVQAQSYGKNFKVCFLDVSAYNRKEAGDAYLKACQFGIPMISYYCASQGLGQAELDSMSYLEGTVLGLQDIFRPLVSSSQMSGNSSTESNGATDEGGAPTKELGEVSDSREANREGE